MRKGIRSSAARSFACWYARTSRSRLLEMTKTFARAIRVETSIPLDLMARHTARKHHRGQSPAQRPALRPWPSQWYTTKGPAHHSRVSVALDAHELSSAILLRHRALRYRLRVITYHLIKLPIRHNSQRYISALGLGLEPVVIAAIITNS